MDNWVNIIRSFYLSGDRVSQPKDIEKMLCLYLLQCLFNLSDEALEESIYDFHAFRSFMQINFIDEQVPDSPTLLKFRHLLEKHNIAKIFFDSINKELEHGGYMMHGGSIADAIIIQAPSSTKNRKKERDPEMHSTKKGNQFYFGMKAHIGGDAASGLVHTLETTPANVLDIPVGYTLIRKGDKVVYDDAGYIGMDKREE